MAESRAQGKHAAEEQKKKNPFVGILGMLATVLVLVWLMRTFVFGSYVIPSSSMESTIHVNDMVFSEKVSYYFGEPKQGDIVTFEDPDLLHAERILIKRIVAVGGQTVNLKNGVVFVDNVPLSEEYTRSLPSNPAPDNQITYPYTVPEGYLWVMGDNRTNSQDSRYFGAVPVSSVTGRAVFIYWPFDRLGFLN